MTTEYTDHCFNYLFIVIFQILDYFSYEHFYVIYCKFWELDSDHDLLIDEKDLMRHNNHGMRHSYNVAINSKLKHTSPLGNPWAFDHHPCQGDGEFELLPGWGGN